VLAAMRQRPVFALPSVIMKPHTSSPNCCHRPRLQLGLRRSHVAPATCLSQLPSPPVLTATACPSHWHHVQGRSSAAGAVAGLSTPRVTSPPAHEEQLPLQLADLLRFAGPAVLIPVADPLLAVSDAVFLGQVRITSQLPPPDRHPAGVCFTSSQP
jgi:hypothetical protein